MKSLGSIFRLRSSQPNNLDAVAQRPVTEAPPKALNPATFGQGRTGAPQARAFGKRTTGNVQRAFVGAKLDLEQSQSAANKAVVARVEAQAIDFEATAQSRLNEVIPNYLRALRHQKREAHADTLFHAGDNEAAKTERARDLTAADFPDVVAADLVKHLQSAPLTINFDPDRATQDGRTVIDAMLGDTHVRNQFETGHTGGLGLSSRMKFEANIFSEYQTLGDNAAQPKERPKYAAVNVLRRATGGTRTYGDCYFELNPQVASMTTITKEDSESAFDSQTATLANPSLALSNMDGDKIKLLVQSIHDPDNIPETREGFYVEAQIHGPVRFGKEVTGMVCDPRFKGTDTEAKLRVFAKKNGIRLRWTDDASL